MLVDQIDLTFEFVNVPRCLRRQDSNVRFDPLVHRSKRRLQPEFGKIDAQQGGSALTYEPCECVSALAARVEQMNRFDQRDDFAWLCLARHPFMIGEAALLQHFGLAQFLVRLGKFVACFFKLGFEGLD